MPKNLNTNITYRVNTVHPILPQDSTIYLVSMIYQFFSKGMFTLRWFGGLNVMGGAC